MGFQDVIVGWMDGLMDGERRAWDWILECFCINKFILTLIPSKICK